MNEQRFLSLPGIERFLFVEETDSINTRAHESDETPADGLFVLVAGRQRAGRGQRGNSFFSAVTGGLWMSLVVRVDDIGSHFEVNRVLALAACDAVHAQSGLSCSVKWPNDIYVGERKLGGILLESTSARPGVIVAGLGLNVNIAPHLFPESLRALATSVLRETGREHDIEQVLEHLLTGFVNYRSRAIPVVHARYRAHLAGLGRKVRIGEQLGRFVDVAEDGRACLEVGEGQTRYCSSGPMRFVDWGRLAGK